MNHRSFDGVERHKAKRYRHPPAQIDDITMQAELFGCISWYLYDLGIPSLRYSYYFLLVIYCISATMASSYPPRALTVLLKLSWEQLKPEQNDSPSDTFIHLPHAIDATNTSDSGPSLWKLA